MPFFKNTKPETTGSALTAADLQALHVAVSSLRSDVAAVREFTEAQGRALAVLPSAVLERFENEASALAGKLASAAWRKAREELVSGVFKWGLRSVYGLVLAAVTTWWTGVLGGLHK